MPGMTTKRLGGLEIPSGKGSGKKAIANYTTLNHALKSGKVPTIVVDNMRLSWVGFVLDQHLLKTRPSHRSLATLQTSELVGKAPKTCNSYPDAIFKWHH